MPIRLNDVSTVHRFEPEPGIAFSYRRAKSGEVFTAVRETSSPDGKPDLVAADAVVLASCLVSWEGIVRHVVDVPSGLVRSSSTIVRQV